jgi:hypothetical protein
MKNGTAIASQWRMARVRLKRYNKYNENIDHFKGWYCTTTQMGYETRTGALFNASRSSKPTLFADG